LEYSRKIKELRDFVEQEIDIFMTMLKDTTFEVYRDNQILRRAIDKSLNDIVLACVDIAAVLLRIKKRVLPKTYKEIILATHEFIGDISLKIAPLIACRNETIHGYLKLNWENVKIVKNAKNDILEYLNKIMNSLKEA